MTHKENMEYLKQNDPIRYYEMTDDPTGIGSGGEGYGVHIVGLIIVVIMTICMALIYC